MPAPAAPPHPARVLIVARGRTVADVARAIGYSPTTLTLVLRRRVAPWPKLRRRLADELGVPEAELFDDRSGGTK